MVLAICLLNLEKVLNIGRKQLHNKRDDHQRDCQRDYLIDRWKFGADRHDFSP
jgi:hypothetical protein